MHRSGGGGCARGERLNRSHADWSQNRGRPLRAPMRYEGLSRRVCRATRFRSALVCMQVLTTAPPPTRFRSALVCMQVLTTAPPPTRFRSALVCMQVLTTAPLPTRFRRPVPFAPFLRSVLSLSTHAVILNRHTSPFTVWAGVFVSGLDVGIAGSRSTVLGSASCRARACAVWARVCAQKRETRDTYRCNDQK